MDDLFDTLGNAKRMVTAQRRDGVRCPCCDLWVQEYDRPIHKMMAVALVALVGHHKRRKDADPMVSPWFNAGDYLENGARMNLLPMQIRGDWPKLRFWDLLHEHPETELGGPRLYAVNHPGQMFVAGRSTVPRRMRIFNNRSLGPVDPNDQINIHEALTTKFDLESILRGGPAVTEKT